MRTADVYSKAARVVVWLGPESGDTAVAIEYIKTVASHIEVNWAMQTMKSISDDATWADESTKLNITSQEMTALEHFLLRSWFERLWIWQEIKLASSIVIVMCGQQAILWPDIRNMALCIFVKPVPGVLANSCIYTETDNIHFAIKLSMLNFRT